MTIALNLYETAALAVVVLFVGMKLKQKIAFLGKVFIPSPAIGGIFFSLITLLAYLICGCQFTYDVQITKLCIMVFLTAISFEFDFATIKSSIKFILLLFLAGFVIMFLINLTSVGLGLMLNIDPLVALQCSSLKILMDKVAVNWWLEYFATLGVANAVDLGSGSYNLSYLISIMISAYFGLLLIKKYHLKPTQWSKEIGSKKNFLQADFKNFPAAVYQLCIAMGIGYVLSALLHTLGISISDVICSMFVAIVMTNYSRQSKKFSIYNSELDYFGGVGLSLFLGIYFMSIQLWTIAYLNPIMMLFNLILIVAIVIFVFVFVFIFCGRNYDAAVLSSGCIGVFSSDISCGFASVMMLNNTCGVSLKGFLLLALMTSFAINLCNHLIIYLFLGFI